MLLEQSLGVIKIFLIAFGFLLGWQISRFGLVFLRKESLKFSFVGIKSLGVYNSLLVAGLLLLLLLLLLIVASLHLLFAALDGRQQLIAHHC